MRVMYGNANIKQILDFYLEAGVNETIGETPIDHFALKPPVKSAPAEQTARRPLPTARAATVSVSAAKPPRPNAELVNHAKSVAADCATIDALKNAIELFDGCSLKELATHTVFARGNAKSPLMLIDRPAASDEDRTGLPFSGQSGELLSKMLNAIGLSEDDVYMTSILPWRPPGGRAPTTEEQAVCLPFVERHIELTAPQTVILFGEAASFLTGQKSGINRLRGKWLTMEYGETSVRALPMFHPAFLLEHPASKKIAWKDLLAIQSAINAAHP